MSKTTSFVAAFGAFGALAYLLNPLPPDAQLVKRAATSQATVPPAPAAIPQAASETPQTAVPGTAAQNAAVRLVQQIQTELLRLGCYAGAVDGRWTDETQQAMHALGERVRVLRPVETPDYIMLALARGQASHVCTARDRATAAAHRPARIVPSAAPLERPQHSPGTTSAQRGPEDRVRANRRAESTARSSNIRPADRDALDADVDDTVLPYNRSALAEAPMGLGAARIDPLQAGIDPRNPTEPAILRAPAPRAEREVRRPTPSRSARNDWKRSVFSKMRENGP